MNVIRSTVLVPRRSSGPTRRLRVILGFHGVHSLVRESDHPCDVRVFIRKERQADAYIHVSEFTLHRLDQVVYSLVERPAGGQGCMREEHGELVPSQTITMISCAHASP